MHGPGMGIEKVDDDAHQILSVNGIKGLGSTATGGINEFDAIIRFNFGGEDPFRGTTADLEPTPKKPSGNNEKRFKGKIALLA